MGRRGSLLRLVHVPIAPGFALGEGDRAHNCRKYEDCLDVFLTRHPGEREACCPVDCSERDDLTREDHFMACSARARGWEVL
jgi:hypothetical protein